MASSCRQPPPDLPRKYDNGRTATTDRMFSSSTGLCARISRTVDPDATDAEVEDAARRANAHEFIVRLPEQYDTFVGERDVKLVGAPVVLFGTRLVSRRSAPKRPNHPSLILVQNRASPTSRTCRVTWFRWLR